MVKLEICHGEIMMDVIFSDISVMYLNIIKCSAISVIKISQLLTSLFVGICDEILQCGCKMFNAV